MLTIWWLWWCTFVFVPCFYFFVCFFVYEGLDPEEHVELTAMDHKAHRMCSKNNNKTPHFYTYQEGSEGEESEQNLSVSTKHASLNVNHQGSQCSMSSNEMDNMHSVRNEVVSRLSDSDPDNQTQHVHSPHGHNKFHHAGNDCTSQTTFKNQFHIKNIQMYFICIIFFFCYLD